MTPNVINGHVRVIGTAPDGDTVRFLPDDPDELPTRAHRFADGSVTVRLDGAEALEVWYTPPSSRTRWHQPLDLADAAAHAVLEALGLTGVCRDHLGRVVDSQPETVPAHVAVRTIDSQGRLIALLVPGRLRANRRTASPTWDAQGADLAPYSSDQVRGSVNWMLLRQGLAYPWLSVRHRPAVRDEFVLAAEHARGRFRGVWPRDVGTEAFTVTGAVGLCDDLVMLPRLFRRIADHLDGLGLHPDRPGRAPGTLAGVRRQAVLRTADVLVLPEGAVHPFDACLEVNRQRVRLLLEASRIVMLD